MSWLRTLIAIALITTMFLIAIGATPNSRDYRYRIGYGPCLNNIIAKSPNNIDLAGIGGSRLLTLLMPNEIIESSKVVLKKPLRVVNFAKSWYGPDYELQLLQDIYASGIRIENLLVQIEPQRKEPFHPHAYNLLRSSNILDLVINAGVKSKIDAWSFLIKAHLLKLKDIAFQTGKAKAEKLINKKNGDGNTCYPKDYKIDQAKLNKSIKRYRANGIREGGFSLEKSNFSYSDFHYKKIVALAKSHNTNVYFIRVPRINTARVNDEAATKIEERYGVKLIRLPVELRQKLVDGGYRDGSHIHEQGRNIVIPWLLKEVYNAG